jgi:multiple sugar transport system permease protein
MLMSLFSVGSVTDAMKSWVFRGTGNFIEIFQSPSFRSAMFNFLKIWLIGGAIVIALATVYSVVINSGVKGKNFWRSVIYLPHIINVVALCSMWIQFAYNPRIPVLSGIFSSLGVDTSPAHIFAAMLVAYVFGSVGFYVLILVAGMDSIPKDYYEAAEIEGAGKVVQLFKITIPLIKDIYKRCIVLYSAGAVGFFAYTNMFSLTTQKETIVPLKYLYENVFGSDTIALTRLNVGGGAAVGVVMMAVVVIVNMLLDLLIPSDVDKKVKKARSAT